jgi:phospholipid/cholesterol/gamma-HCH transport system ATP-binding protein
MVGHPPAIEYLDVYKAFDAPVLKGVSLRIEAGEKVAIVGPSGTGKSVLLKTTNGLVLPDRGDVRVEGESIYFGSSGALDRARRAIGYVFQYAALMDSQTVYDNVALGISDDEAQRIGPAEVFERVAAALREVRLDPEFVMDKLPGELSGGMRKRVGLARAVVARPRILLYDEPVTGLDPVTAAAVDRLIRDVSARLSATSVLVTHDVQGALELCDRVALLDRGKIRFAGTPEQFRASEDPLVRAFSDRKIAEEFADKFEEAS